MVDIRCYYPALLAVISLLILLPGCALEQGLESVDQWNAQIRRLELVEEYAYSDLAESVALTDFAKAHKSDDQSDSCRLLAIEFVIISNDIVDIIETIEDGKIFLSARSTQASGEEWLEYVQGTTNIYAAYLVALSQSLQNVKDYGTELNCWPG